MEKRGKVLNHNNHSRIRPITPTIYNDIYVLFMYKRYLSQNKTILIN